jgi:hypothetical protein
MSNLLAFDSEQEAIDQHVEAMLTLMQDLEAQESAGYTPLPIIRELEVACG